MSLCSTWGLAFKTFPYIWITQPHTWDYRELPELLMSSLPPLKYDSSTLLMFLLTGFWVLRPCSLSCRLEFPCSCLRWANEVSAGMRHSWFSHNWIWNDFHASGHKQLLPHGIIKHILPWTGYSTTDHCVFLLQQLMLAAVWDRGKTGRTVTWPTKVNVYFAVSNGLWMGNREGSLCFFQVCCGVLWMTARAVRPCPVVQAAIYSWTKW